MGESASEERVHAPKAKTAPAQVRPPKPKQFIAPANSASPVPTGDSKQAMQWDAKVATLKTNVGEATLKVRFEMSHRREGETSVRGELGERDGSVRVGELQQVMNREISAKGEKFAAKFKTALLAVDYELLQDGTLELAGVPINIKLDTKALEMDGGTLYAGKLAIVGEGDVSAWIPGPFKTVVQLRLELAIPADVIVKLYESKQAAKAIEKFRAADARFRTAERQVQKTRTYIRRLEERAGQGLSPKDSARLAKYRQDLFELQAAKTKLQSLRNKLSAARDRGIKTLQRVAEKLNKTPLGRVAMKVATKVVGKILGKLIPIYNIIQTAKDLYELAKAIGSIDWNNESGGEYNPDGESVEGADAPTDESNDGKQSEGEGKQGEGKQGGESEDADGVPADLQDLSDLEPTDGQLSPVAAQVTEAVRKKSGESSDAAALTPDEIDTLNEIIPADLDADEVARLQALLQASLSRSGELQTLTEAVVGAMQSVRPEGVKRKPDPVLAHEPVAVSEAARVPKPKKKVKKAKGKRKPKEPAPAKPVDLRAYLFEHVLIDPETRRLVYPNRFAIGDIKFKVSDAKVSYQLVSGASDLYAMAYVTVEVIANPHGRTIVGQPRSTVESVLLEIFEARTSSSPAANPQSSSATQRTPV